MGLFSNKKKYVVNVTVQPIFDEKQIPTSIKSGIIKGILAEGDIKDYMLEEVSGCIGIKANNGYGWAKRNNYAAGIPTAQMRSNVDAKTAVLSAIAVNVGGAITTDYYRFGPMNSLHYAWTWISNVHGYNAETNELVGLTASTGYKCYLKNMRATYTRESYDFITSTYDTGVFAQLGPSPSSGYTPSNPFTAMGGIGPYAGQPAYEVSDVATEDYVTVTYEFKDNTGKIVERGITVSVDGFDEQGDFHQVRYKRPDGKTGFFTYLNGSGTYPSVDAVYRLDYNNLGTFYPWGYFRLENRRVGDYFEYDVYEDCKKWCRYIGVDYDMMSDGVHQDPEVDDVAQCIIQMGVNPGSQNEAVLEYLFKHFSILHEYSLTQMQLSDNLPDKFLAFSNSPGLIQQIGDRKFSQTLQYTGLHKKRITGSIGKKGTYTGTYGQVPQDAQNFVAITPVGTEARVAQNTQPAYIYRYQVLDSMYEEIAVYGLRIDYNVHRKKGFGAGAGASQLLVPLDRAVMRTVSVGRREQVMCRALHMLVNTVQVITTKWYQSSVFKWVMVIVAVVITVLSAGTAWQTLVAAFALGATALAIAVLTMILQVVAAQIVIKLFIKLVGPQIGIVVAIAALVYGSYTSYNATGNTKLWGDSLVQLGNNLVTESSSAYQSAAQKAIADIAKDFEEFNAFATGQFDSLKDQRDKLGLDPQFMGLDGMDIVNLIPDTIFGETPQDYYSRTVHSGNIGTTSYDLIEYYHYYALQLPKLSDVEEFTHGTEFPES